MNRENLRDLLFFSILLVLSVVGFVYIFTSGRGNVIDSDSWVRHSYNVIIATQKLDTLPNRMLLEQRSYLLTDDEIFLNAYKSVRDETFLQMDTLHSLTRDNMEQTGRLVAIQALLTNFTEQLEERLSVLHGRRFNLDAFMKGYDELEDTRKNLTVAIHDFLVHEQDILLERTQETNEKREQYYNSLVVGSGAGSLLLVAINAFLFFVHGRRQRAERQLEDSKQRFQLALRGSNDGIFDFDVATGKMLYSMPRAIRSISPVANSSCLKLCCFRPIASSHGISCLT